MKKKVQNTSLFRKKHFILGCLVVITLLISFFRIYNLDTTARFTRDESSDLARMHMYYVTHKLTLVGPISSTNNKVFSSQTYYMLMPFAIVGGFEPVSPAYGTAFWGIITALVLIAITYKVNKLLLPFVIPISMLWYPLLETSRWAWNPHLIPLWIALGIWFYFRKSTLSYFLSGICLSLAFHNHYIAIIATGVFVLSTCVIMALKKNYKQPLLFVLGYVLPFIPFVIFDLRHPPGLFFTSYLAQGNISDTKSTTFLMAMSDIGNNIGLFFTYSTQNFLLAILLGMITLIILFFDIKNNRKYLLFVAPLVAQLGVGAFLTSLQPRYILPALLFFFVWLILPRKSLAAVFAKISLGIIIVGSLLSVYPQLHTTIVQPDTHTISNANKIIIETIHKNKLKNVNIASLASPNSDTLALNIRDSLQIRDTHFLAASQYDVSEQLLVLSTADEKTLRNDPAYPMQQFKKASLGGVYPLEDSQWKVYWFKKL